MSISTDTFRGTIPSPWQARVLAQVLKETNQHIAIGCSDIPDMITLPSVISKMSGEVIQLIIGTKAEEATSLLAPALSERLVLTYPTEDVLDWDATVVPFTDRSARVITVRLRRVPGQAFIPVESPWAE